MTGIPSPLRTGMLYQPQQWYWLATDGRLYSGPTQTTVTTADSGYQAWIADGIKVATPWPVDDVGAQTTASLQAVLTPYGMTVP
jgi:hypothetical protein